MAYAEDTKVPFERSLSEIVSLVRKAGAKNIAQFEGDNYFAIQFESADRLIRFKIPFPCLGDMPTRDGRGASLSVKQRESKLDQSRRSRGRALLLVIKAKLESVESGIETFEQAFLANVVMSDGSTVYERVASPLAIEYQTGRPAAATGLLPPPRQ